MKGRKHEGTRHLSRTGQIGRLASAWTKIPEPANRCPAWPNVREEICEGVLKDFWRTKIVCCGGSTCSMTRKLEIGRKECQAYLRIFFSVYGPACRYNFRKANLELLCNCLLGTSGTYSSVELECAFRQMGLLQRIHAQYPDHVSVLRGSRLAGAMRKVLAWLSLAVEESGHDHSIYITVPMACFNTIAVHITLKDSGGIEQHVVLPNIKRPVEYKVLAEHIRRMGGISRSLTNASLTIDFFNQAIPHTPVSPPKMHSSLKSQLDSPLSMRPPEARSTCSLITSLLIKEILIIVIISDQPLILYYNDCYLPVAYPQDEARPEQCSGAEILSDQKIKVGGLATVGFQRWGTFQLSYSIFSHKYNNEIERSVSQVNSPHDMDRQTHLLNHHLLHNAKITTKFTPSLRIWSLPCIVRIFCVH